MPNTSHCRFTNTAADLADCIEFIEEDASLEEHKARINLVRLCAKIAINYTGGETLEDAVEWAKDLPVQQ